MYLVREELKSCLKVVNMANQVRALMYHCNTHLGLLSRLLRLRRLVGGHPLVAGAGQALARADRHHVDGGRLHLRAADRSLHCVAVLTSGVHEGGIVIPIAVDHSGLTGGHYLVGGDGGGWGGG